MMKTLYIPTSHMGTHLSDFILTYESEPNLYWFIIVLASQNPRSIMCNRKKNQIWVTLIYVNVATVFEFV